MSDQTPDTPAPMSKTAEFEAFAKQLFTHLEPMIVQAAKTAVGIANPIAGALVAPALDAVDQLVRAHNPSIVVAETNAGDPAAEAALGGKSDSNATSGHARPSPAPIELPVDSMQAILARLASLEANVAALLVATG
jgi:hypothetical protein